MLPDGVTPLVACLLACASFFTSALTAAFGVGGGVALLVVMGYLLPVAALVPVHGVVQWGSNAGRAAVQRQFVQWRAVLPFVAGSALGAIAAAPFVARLDDPLMKLALGVFIIFVTWARLPALANASPGMMVAGGVGTNFLSMFFGATGPLTAAFFARSFDDRRAYIASHAAAMTCQHALKVVAFALAGFAFFQWLPLMAAMIATGYLGTLAGTQVLHAMPEHRFRLIFSIMVTVLALDLVRRGAQQMLY